MLNDRCDQGRTRSSLRTNIVWGLYWGLGTAMLLSVFAWVVTLNPQSRALDKAGVTFGQAFAVYFAGGVGGGVLLGLLRPFLRTLVGQMIVGIFVIAPASFVYTWLTTPRPLGAMLTHVALMSLFMGPLYALGLWIFNRYSGPN